MKFQKLFCTLKLANELFNRINCRHVYNTLYLYILSQNIRVSNDFRNLEIIRN